MFDTKPEHAKEYGLDSVNPLYVQSLCITENKRLKGVGKKVLQYIDDYAIKNGHDLVFGHITQKAKFTKDNSLIFFRFNR
jgi:GNAT superfamily N-acetyltransferase